MKFILLTWLFVCGANLIIAQPKQLHTSFRDYPLVANFDSLALTIDGLKTNPHAYLYGLITLEKNRIDYPGLFGQHLDTIRLIAIRLRSPLAIATHQYLQSVYLRETNLGAAARNGLDALRYFESTKDTSGILACYASMVLISMNSEEYHIKNVQKQACYYDRIMVLGGHSTNVEDRLVRLKTILSLEKFVKGKQDFSVAVNTVDETLRLLTENPGTKPVQAALYTSIARFYDTYSQRKISLAYSIKSYELFKKKSPKTCALASYNLGYNYFNDKSYDKSQKYYQEAIDYLEESTSDKFSLLISSYMGLADILFINKQYDAAWTTKEKIYGLYNRRHQRMKRSLFEELETQHETDQKAAENKLLIKKNELAESRNKHLAQESKINLLVQKNKLVKSQNLNYHKELENKLLLHKNQLIEARFRLYQLWLAVSGLVSVIVGLLFYLLYKSTVKQKEVVRFRERLYAIIAHDIREPINSLMSAGTLLLYLIKNNRNDDIERVTQKIDLMGQQISLLLTNLLDWGKSTYLDQHAVPKLFDAAPLLRELAQLYVLLAETKGITLAIKVPDSYLLTAHPKDVALIVRNLLDNALKYTRKGGNVTLSVQPDKSIIRVEDTGVGMAPDQLIYIQQVFSGKQTPQVGEQGIGLGLLLITDFARKNGATLRLSSQEGLGSAFDLIMV